jgi:hypothetical protein
MYGIYQLLVCDVLESSHEYQVTGWGRKNEKGDWIITRRIGNFMTTLMQQHSVPFRGRSSSFLFVSCACACVLGCLVWIPTAGDSGDDLAASLSVDTCACPGADEDADRVSSRRKLPRIGMPDAEPARRVLTEIFRASHWKFCEEMRLRFAQTQARSLEFPYVRASPLLV